MSNPECPTDAPYPNVFEVESRSGIDGDISATIKQTVRAWINARNSTVCFRGVTTPPTREQVLAQAIKEGACNPEASRDYTGVCVEPMNGGGFMASIEQLDYAYPVSFHKIKISAPENITDAEIIAAARRSDLIAGEFSA